ncbi:MAG: proton extrusion protein PcxA, partial [Microcystis aeruginosa L311-01]|nr:proton extrusion protein PcxA [Microcystis aeruginosa L311-01]
KPRDKDNQIISPATSNKFFNFQQELTPEYEQTVIKQLRLFVTWYGSIGGHKLTKSLSGKRLN